MVSSLFGKQVGLTAFGGSSPSVTERGKNMWVDNVKCSNCEFNGFVDIGAEECPACNMIGSLSWIDGEPQEVDLYFSTLIKKYIKGSKKGLYGTVTKKI